jgi:hypothetical protein
VLPADGRFKADTGTIHLIDGGDLGLKAQTGVLVENLAHQPLRCTTSSKGRRFKRVPGLSGRSAG